MLRGTDPVAKLNTFENLRFDGDLVQTWLSGPFGTPTAKNVFVRPTYPEEWIPFDSHLLISSMPPPTMIGSGFFNGISETNDESIGEIPGLPSVVGNPFVSGIGPISMFRPTDAFFLVPDFESNEVAVAYLVRQAGADSHFTMTLGVLGSGIINSGEPGGASFGFNGNDPVEIHFVPEPSAEFLAMFA